MQYEHIHKWWKCKNANCSLPVCEQLSGREKPGKLKCSKDIKSSCIFKDVRVLLLKQPNFESGRKESYQIGKDTLQVKMNWAELRSLSELFKISALCPLLPMKASIF